ncbi:MAG: serine hydrolase [Bacteroidota bacterium]
MKPYYRQLRATILGLILANYALAGDFDWAFEEFSEEVRTHLWLDLRNATESPDPVVISNFGGVLVDEDSFEEIKTLQGTAETAITYALTTSMNIGSRDYPDLRTLAALSDERILDQYIEGYIAEAAALGADFLLLPDTTTLAKEELEVLHKFDEHQPGFFISPTFNHLDGKWKKRDILQHLTPDELFLSDRPLDRRLAKTFKKLDKKPIIASTYGLRAFSMDAPELHEALLTLIYDRSITYIKNQEVRSIPYEKPDLYLLTDRPFGELHQELDRYYRVHLALEEQPDPNALLIVDARWRADYFGPVLAQYDPSLQVLALVSGETDLVPAADEYLFFTENHELHHRKIPQILYGARGVEGRKVGLGLSPDAVYEPIPNFGKLRYAEPEWVGLSSMGLENIQSVAKEMIEHMAAPGCQVTVIKNGAIVYDEAFGHLTYDSLLPVSQQTLYDVASVTKVTATLLAIMHQYEQGHFQLDDSVAMHLEQYQGSNKGQITMRQLLAHHAGLRSYEALWQRKFSGDLLEPFSYASPNDSVNDVRNYGFPIHPVMADSIRSWLVQSPLLRKRDRYHYSDLGFMILQQLSEHFAGMSLEQYVVTHFYHPMGLHRTTFNPLEKGFEIFEIAPTEYDHRYRRSLVWGAVHDRNAAIFGGVAGHAGLFSSSRELAILMNMVLNDGYYVGRRYLSQQTIDTFNQQYFANSRRALGWDKLDPKRENVSLLASPESFGHKGFTGTMVWADPKHDLVYTFVSNRVYPDAKNGKLMRYEVRERMQDIIYKSILSIQ